MMMFFYLFLQKQKIALGRIPLGYSLKKGRRLRNVYWGSDDDTAVKRSSVQAATGSDSVCVTPYGQKKLRTHRISPAVSYGQKNKTTKLQNIFCSGFRRFPQRIDGIFFHTTNNSIAHVLHYPPPPTRTVLYQVLQ